MTIRWLLAAVHLLALGVGLGAVWGRGRALSDPLDRAALRRVFYTDAWWGVAALLWVSTGVTRAFFGYEKGTDYYLANHIFWGKMLLFLVILVLEIGPMLAFIQWRRIVAQGGQPDTTRASRFARISFIQGVCVVLMVLAATAMARGFGLPGA